MWYPLDKEGLEKMLTKLIGKRNPKKEVHGIIVPHAGYIYSGEIAGQAYSVLPKTKKAIVIGPSHCVSFKGIRRLHPSRLVSPFGKINISKSNYEYLNVPEHSITNQIPFLQRLGVKEILPIIVGGIDKKDLKKIVGELLKEKGIFVFSTDLSHFLKYEDAKKIDKNTIALIENLNLNELNHENACGYFPLLILAELCKEKKWKPKLITYKNSGDVSSEKSRVVGYASFYF